MIAAYATELGLPDPFDGLEVGDRPEPSPRLGWELVELRAASANPHDVWTLKGSVAFKFDLPVIPVATSLGLLWNRRDWRKKAGRCAIEFLPAIETGLDKRTFMRRLEDAIETASDRLIAEFSGRPYTPSQLVLRSQGQTGIGQPINAPRAAL